MKMWSAYLLILAALAVQFELGQSVDMMYSDPSRCVDPSGFSSCVERAYKSRGDCFGKNCYSGSNSCSKACNGDDTCMQEKCPDLGVDCRNTCACVEAQDVIDCTATSCWNEVYSCEYAETVSQLVYSCANVDLGQIPFWPTPDNATGACACNVGKLTKEQFQIGNQVEECANNMTNLNPLSTVKDMTDYSRACLCCAMSAMVASIWDTCPNTKPSLITADYWNKALLGPNDWDACVPYLQQYDCARTLGFGAAAAGGTQNFYQPGKTPKNGTGLLTKMDGVISTPVSGSTFTWTFGTTALHPITAAATNTAVPSATDDSGQGEGTANQGAQKTSGGEPIVPIQSRPSILVAAIVIGFCIGLLGF